MKKKLTIRRMTMCALFAALLAVCSQIVIPISVIPINLALFAVYMAGAMCGPIYGGISVTVYILLGAVGVSVFAGMRGGIGTLFGPTGGYIIGFLFAALICGALITIKKDKFFIYPLSMISGCAVCYLFGTLWYALSTHTAFAAAISLCVLPYLPGDAIKIILASVLANRLNRILKGKI